MNGKKTIYILTGMNRWMAAALATIFVAGVFFSWWTMQRADRQMRDDLLLQVRLVERAVYGHRVKTLTGTEADLEKPDYRQLKEQLSYVRQANDNCRFLYIMGRKNDGTVFFYLDSEPVTSKGYSPPGQLYEEASKDLREVFNTGRAVVEGPVSDRWGKWVSAIVPITDPATDQLLGVLGMDIDARTWKRDVAVHATLPVGLMLALMLLLALWLIAARSRTELHESEEKFRVLANATPTAVLLYQDDRYIYTNKAAETISGYSAKELFKINFWELIHPDHRALIQERGRKRQRGKEATNRYEIKIITKNGIEKWVDLTGASTMIGGQPAGIISVIDITERKQTEEELTKVNKLQSVILDNSTVGIALVRNRVFEWVNPRMPELFGFPQERFRGASTRIIYPSDQAYEKLGRDAYPILAQGEKAAVEIEMRKGDGSSFWCRLEGKALDASKSNDGSIWIWEDITERKRVEEALRETQAFYHSLVDQLPAGVFRKDREGRFVFVSPWFCRLKGMKEEEFLGKTPREVIANEAAKPVANEHGIKYAAEGADHHVWIMQTGNPVELIEEYTPDAAGGKQFVHAIKIPVFNSVGKVIGTQGVLFDITERKRAEEEKRGLEERLNRAEKMEALGQMAGGVAHDLNNILGILTGYSELLLMEIPERHRSRSHVEKILQSTEKGAAIIQDLLTLARRGVVVSDVINLNSVVSGFLKIPVFEKMKDYHPRVTFRTECDKNLLNIKGSSVHLEKTLMNLVSNAAESISGPGEVTIRTQNRYLDKSIRGYDEVKEGDYAVLTVSDTGMGIPAEDRNKIFEPFYTKKKMGRSGTGLGLAIVWGTVKDHDGYIDLQTEVGKGTTFTLYFPVTREELIAPQQKVPIEQYMGKGESVLVVDDIAEQRDVASKLLTQLGYEVHMVSSGEEAVEYLKANKADILILDMIMAPGIDGLATYQKVLDVNPKQKAILVSGFSETDRVREAQRLGAGAYVKKPYVMEKIGMAIRNELRR